MHKLLLIIFLAPLIGHSQNLDTAMADTTEKAVPDYYWGAFATGGISLEPSASAYNTVGVLGAGLQYNQWRVSFTLNQFLGSYQSFVVFPSVFELDYRYVSVELAYRFYQNKYVGLFLAAAYARGEMTWTNLSDGEVFLSNRFDLGKFGVGGEFLKLRFVKPYIRGGYQKARNLNLPKVGAEDLSGWYLHVGVRLGYFNQ